MLLFGLKSDKLLFLGGCPKWELFFGVEQISIIFWVAEKVNSGQNEFLEIDSIGLALTFLHIV